MFDLKEDTICYQNDSYESKNLIWVLLSNALRTLKSVYLFQNFEEYSRQLISDKNEDKQAVYWAASHDEKLIDYIKISIAFETFNKAILMKNGVVIHKIDKKFNRPLNKLQSEGKPVYLEDFLKNNYTNLDADFKTAELNGFDSRYTTINYSHTLHNDYQKILQLDKQLVGELIQINEKRNRLHFYSNFHGAFSVHDHLKKWKYIMDTSIKAIEEELLKQEQLLNEHESPFYSTFN